MEQKVEKPKIIVYHNTILDRKVYIVVFINQPFNFDLDFDKAKEILHQYSSSKYIGIATGRNAITFIERKENLDRLLPTSEEFMLGKLMLMTLPGKRCEHSYKEFKYMIKLYDLKKAVKFKVKE